MKKLFLSLVLLFSIIPIHTPAYAAGGSSDGNSMVYDTYHDGGKKSSESSGKNVDSHSSSLFPIFLKFIGSLALVIFLIYALYRYVLKRGGVSQAGGPILPLAGHMIGQNKSLQVVLIGQTIYILGVGENVTLIKTISQGEEYQHLLESYENQAAESQVAKWPVKEPKLIWESIFQNHLKKIEKENQKGQGR